MSCARMFQLRQIQSDDDDEAVLAATWSSLPPASREHLHLAVCDRCECMILGVRFKCAVCDDYDLCWECSEANAAEPFHDESHCFLKLYHALPSTDLIPNIQFPVLADAAAADDDDAGAANEGVVCDACGAAVPVPPDAVDYCLHCQILLCAQCECAHSSHHARLAWRRPPPADLRTLLPQLPVLCLCAPRTEGDTAPAFGPGKDGAGAGADADADAEAEGELAFTMRAMTPADLDAVSAVDAECFTAPWDAGFHGQLMTNDAYAPRIASTVAVDASTGALAGYVIDERRGGEYRSEAYVMSLAVRRAYRRHGVGRLLLAHALREAHESARLESATLHVNVANGPARRLYERLGFFVVQRVDGYYREDGDALFMRALLPALTR